MEYEVDDLDKDDKPGWFWVVIVAGMLMWALGLLAVVLGVLILLGTVSVYLTVAIYNHFELRGIMILLAILIVALGVSIVWKRK